MSPLRPDVTINVPTTAEEATAEVQRLMAGIHGFHPDCKVVEVKRVDDMWIAKIDDPEDEFEYHWFSIADDGECDWD